MLDHEPPLSGFDRSLGGSAGEGTFGGTAVERPEGMPTKADADHVVTTKSELLDAVSTDDAIVYIDEDIDVTGVEDYLIGDNVTLVGGFCDPNIPGRGPVIHSDEPSKYVFRSAYGEAPTLWGVSFEGPQKAYKDPDHTADDFNETFASALFCFDDDKLEVVGCEFWGWTMAGLLVGAKGTATEAEVERCSFHHCQMEHLGYGIQHYNGSLSVNKCFFDKCRHGISSFGYPSGGYAIANSVIGPGDWCGHALDMHSLTNNLDTDDRTAGDYLRVYRCTLMSTWDRGGYDQEAIAIRGESDRTSYADKCHFYHDGEPTPTGGQGDAYRQETGWSDTPNSWRNFEPRDNVFGERDPVDVAEGYGAPRADERPAEDDEDEQTDDPSEQPATDSMKLMIKGRNIPANYRITVQGSATPTDQANPGDRVRSNDDGTVTITGYVHKHQDSYDIGDDAQLHSVRASGPIDVYRGGKQVDLAPLVAAGAWKRPSSGDGSDAVSQLRSRVEDLASKVNSARVVFGGGGE